MRKRAALILIENKQVALIKRVRDGETYYVYPGGGIETGESPIAAAKREGLEELGVDVEIGPCVYELTGKVHEVYYLARITGGKFGTGRGEEFTKSRHDRGSYEAVWMPLPRLKTISLYPEEIDVGKLTETGSVDIREKGIVKEIFYKME